ncbi:hypothetical protein B1J93_01490 [Leptospira kirschneri serovar Pomona]|uniref:Uncharacterized protein n=1 Tax=Leptospira kirschneri serovar Pomona TaxID=561005 RepID=A0A1T1E2R2_9LEPT|nr:hypothetical protein B1J94_17400 [Leptospira kirschneri serovar Grippotyphosa]OOV47332.1 hypothetical protein B1J93_01490 [Leptospira kirschneri serovar Pomona]
MKFLRESFIRGFSVETIVPFYNRNLSKKLECLERFFISDDRNSTLFFENHVEYDSFGKKSSKFLKLYLR